MTREEIGVVCLALPATTRDHPFGDDHDVYKVGGKMFALVGGMGGLSFKVNDVAYEMLVETGRAEPAPYLARAKWVRLANAGDWSGEDLRDYLKAAHAMVAAKLTLKARAALGLA